MRIFALFLTFMLCFHEIFNIRFRRNEKFEAKTFTTCFEDIGCIETTEKWYDAKHRPKNLEPLDKHTIRTEFLLMKKSKNNSNELVYDVMNMKKESIEVSGYRTGTCTIFVIHDFTSNGYTGWIKHLVLAFTRKTDCNVISIDWQAGAEPPFDQAIANARVVALEAKCFLILLQNSFGQCMDNIHIIGHGVGAHIAGYIGKYIQGVQRITGLDPTGPRFEKMPSEVRLDVDDAKYVEILHTDYFNHRSQGGRIAHGHADFIINNAGHQPGCNDSSHMPSFLDLHRDKLQEGKILPACSHKRAFKYYIQALEDDDCQFIGLKCDSFEHFQLGKCNDCSGPKGSCATFGLEPPAVRTKNNTYFMVTNAKKPFCMVSYSVNITTAVIGKSKKESEGYFDMILVDVDDKVTNATNNVHGTAVRKFESGHTYKFVFYGSSPRMGRIKEAKVKWNYKSRKVCIFCEKSIIVHDIGIRLIHIKEETPSAVSWICPAKHQVIMKSGDYVEFVNCEDLYGPTYPIDHQQIDRSNMAPTYVQGCVQNAMQSNNQKNCMSSGTNCIANGKANTGHGNFNNETMTAMRAPINDENTTQKRTRMDESPFATDNPIPEDDKVLLDDFKKCSGDDSATTTTDLSVCPHKEKKWDELSFDEWLRNSKHNSRMTEDTNILDAPPAL